jgi:hypothetical protein
MGRINSTVQVHYGPTREYEMPTGVIIDATGEPFASLRFGPHVGILIHDPDVLDAIAAAATEVAESLRTQQAAWERAKSEVKA